MLENTGLANEVFDTAIAGTRISDVDVSLVAGANAVIQSADRALDRISNARA